MGDRKIGTGHRWRSPCSFIFLPLIFLPYSVQVFVSGIFGIYERNPRNLWMARQNLWKSSGNLWTELRTVWKSAENLSEIELPRTRREMEKTCTGNSLRLGVFA